MAKLKVSIVDSTTLKLEENGKIGDTIDLHELHKVDSSFILKAIDTGRDEVYAAQLNALRKQLEAEKASNLSELEKKLKSENHQLETEKIKALNELKDKYVNELNEAKNQKLELANQMKMIQEKFDAEKQAIKQIEAKNALMEKQQLENTIKELMTKLDQQRESIELNVEKKLMQENNKKIEEMLHALSKEKAQVEELKGKLQNEELKRDKILSEINSKSLSEINKKERELLELSSKLEAAELIRANKEQSIKNEYEARLKEKQEMVDFYKDLKTKMSTKMLGETLEQHCEIEFNKLRSTAFRNAHFDKDNDAKEGNKGDYIYREFDENGIEIISIMFEMKNEADKTATKQKNEDFLEKLNKDREQKKCEYAVLVTLLESENELYNQGIVDVSHRFNKMYVIRPQFFIAIISLLKNASLNALEYKRELTAVRTQNIDITNFEDDLYKFKDAFNKNYIRANEKFGNAIKEIDRTIATLTKAKEELLSSDRNLRLANDKLDEISIKKLTKNSPTMRKAFEDLNDKKD